jgi:hypothetical protein
MAQAKLYGQRIYVLLCDTKVRSTILQTSGTERNYADNSFGNGDFHVPLTTGTGPERCRNAKRNEAYICRSYVDSLSFT